MMKELTLITTGGTIDGNELEKNSIREKSDAAQWLLQKGIALHIINAFNKDSRELTNTDRQVILNAVESFSWPVMITHGTYTIAETGRYLKSALRGQNRTVLLVGSWKPFHEQNSDAPKQMAFALDKLQNDNVHGVWIAMDNSLWDPNVTEKVQIGPDEFRLDVKKVSKKNA